MQTFKARLWERLESPPQEPFCGVVEPGFRAPGRMVLVVRQGTAWVQREDRTRETAGARSVVMYDAGDWVEYGSDGSGEAFQAELYGAAEFSEEQQAARLARFLGQDGLSSHVR
ncbi:MAG: hypothetical protein ACRDOB_19975 [Streptosporangiaceae bacterium]